MDRRAMYLSIDIADAQAVQLPAVNTTHFGLVKSRLPKKPSLMGTIYQTEVAAQAIVYAAEHSRKEVLVGFSALRPSWATK